ncbi:MAG: hypothetical protein M3Q63_03935 [bacterium]|nr:hypothetical protein [bacterium]
MRKSNNNNSRKLVISVVALVVLMGGVIAYKIFSGPTLKNFSVNQANLVVEANNMEKVEVYAQQSTSKEASLIGAMEIVEQNDANDQTWILLIPTTMGTTTTKIYAQGTTKEGKATKKLELPYETQEEISRALGQTKTSQAVLFGTVNSVVGNILSLNILASTTVKVTLVPNAQVTNKVGQKILPYQLIKGGLVSVTGDFTDEISFTATEVAEENPQ